MVGRIIGFTLLGLLLLIIIAFLIPFSFHFAHSAPEGTFRWRLTYLGITLLSSEKKELTPEEKAAAEQRKREKAEKKAAKERKKEEKLLKKAEKERKKRAEKRRRRKKKQAQTQPSTMHNASEEAVQSADVQTEDGQSVSVQTDDLSSDYTKPSEEMPVEDWTPGEENGFGLEDEPEPEKSEGGKKGGKIAKIKRYAGLAIDAIRALPKLLRPLWRGIHIRNLDIVMHVAKGTAEETAVQYGRLVGIIYPFLGILGKALHIQTKRVNIEPAFNQKNSRWALSGEVHLNIMSVLGAVLGFGIGFLILYIKRKCAQRHAHNA